MRHLLAVILFIFAGAKQTASGQKPAYSQELILGPEVVKLNFGPGNPFVDLLINYHRVMLKDYFYKGEFWTNASKQNYYLPDYMLKQEFVEYPATSIVPNLINLFRPGDYYHTAQVAYHLYEGKENKGLICVYTFAIRNENDSVKFFPLLETYTFKTFKGKDITLHMSDHTRDGNKIIDSIDTYNQKLSKMFSTEPLKPTCYMFRNFSEANECIGLDVQKQYSRDKNCYTDSYNNIIYASRASEFMAMLTHMYIGNKYKSTYHPWIIMGFGLYLGGSMDLSLEQHLKNLAKDLEKRPDYNLNNFLILDRTFVDQSQKNVPTSYKYTLGGLICKLAYEKSGFTAMDQLFSSGLKDEELYAAVEKVLGVKQSNFNIFFRKEIAKYR